MSAAALRSAADVVSTYSTRRQTDCLSGSAPGTAAGECNESGFLPSFVYETPYYHSGATHIEDYALLYVVSVCDYYEHTGDRDVVNELLDICKYPR